MPSTNYPDGITNVAVSTPLGSFVQPDPSRVQLSNDFAITATDWTVVETRTRRDDFGRRPRRSTGYGQQCRPQRR
jgi:hypothetical protein